MFKAQKNSNDSNTKHTTRVPGFGLFSSNFGFVSDFGFRYSDFRLRRAFSFTEVMFAVIILGIGFIMVAGIFPVSLQQAKMTSEEIAGAALARAGASFLGEVFDDALLNAPPLGTALKPSPSPVRLLTFSPAPNAAWEAVVGNMVSAQDPHYAWTAMYRRDGYLGEKRTWSPYAQVYVFALTARNSDRFQPNIDGQPPSTPNYLPNLQPKPVRVAIANDSVIAGGMDVIAIMPFGSVGSTDYTGAAVEGAYVVIAQDEIDPTSANAGRMNGRIFRLGAHRVDLEETALLTAVFPTITSALVYELQPGSDFTPDAGADGVLFGPGIPAGFADDDILSLGLPPVSPSNVTYSDFPVAAIVGRGYEDPAVGGTFAGTSMAIGAYTTMVKINR